MLLFFLNLYERRWGAQIRQKMDKLFEQFAACYGSSEVWPELQKACDGDEILTDLMQRKRSYVDFCIANNFDENGEEAWQLEKRVGRIWQADLFNELVRRTLKLKELGVPRSFFELNED